MANKGSAQKLLSKLQEGFGKDSVMMAADMPRHAVISSGSLALDFAVGVGGFPSDRVIEIAGEEGTGKTTLSILTMQRFLSAQPDRCALILDLEHKMDPDWLSRLITPVYSERVVYVQPDHIEQATNIYKSAAEGGEVCFALLDSIGGAPTSRRNSDAEVGSYGGNAQGVGEFARSAAAMSAKYRCLTVGVNQIREDMSGYKRHMTPGGHAWKHAVALRLQLKRGKGKVTQKVGGEDVQIGYEIACKVVKNGLAAPYRVANWWFYNVETSEYGFGVDTLEEIIRLGILTGVIERRGGWYNHPCLPDGRVMGRERLVDFLRGVDTADLSAEIVSRLGNHATEVAPMTRPDDNEALSRLSADDA